jgi:hypothetical protein
MSCYTPNCKQENEREKDKMEKRVRMAELMKGPYLGARYIPVDGFEWSSEYNLIPPVEGGHGKPKPHPADPVIDSPPWLVRKSGAGDLRLPKVFSAPDLHRRFANIALESEKDGVIQEKILAFAEQWGPLWHSAGLFGGSAPIGSGPVTLASGESYARWVIESTALRAYLLLWDMVKSYRLEDIRKLIDIRWGEPDEAEIDEAMERQPGSKRGAIRKYLGSEGRITIRIPKLLTDRTDYKRGVVEIIEGLIRQGATHAGYVPATLSWQPQIMRQLDTRAYFGGPVVAQIRELRHMDEMLLASARLAVVAQINEKVHGHVHPTLMAFAAEPQVCFIPDCLLSTLYTLFQFEVSGLDLKNLTPVPLMKMCPAPGCLQTFRARGRMKYCSLKCAKYGDALRHRLRYHAQIDGQKKRKVKATPKAKGVRRAKG